MRRSSQEAATPALVEIQEARRLLAPLFEATPTLASPGLSRLAGRAVWLKAENLQVTGSFKIRGAYNRLYRMGRSKGVVAASAGNHAQGVALAASMLGLKSTIVMPEETPLIKVERTKAYGAEVILYGASFEDAFTRASALRDRDRLTLVHAYEDRDVMAGQGTIGLEILEAMPDLDAVLVPVGGGGLISGIAVAIKTLRPEVAVIGVQAAAAAAAVTAFRGRGLLPAGRAQGDTIADAIRFKRASAVTMPIIRKHVDEMLAVPEEAIADGIVRLLEESKLVAEGAGAVGVAALASGLVPKRFARVCAVVSGGNIDLNMTARVLEQGLSRSDRYLVLRSQIPDKPGRLFGLLSHLAHRRINVLDVRHNRAGWRVPLGWVEVEALVETRDAAHATEIVSSLEAAGYRILSEVARPDRPGSGRRASRGRGSAGHVGRRG